MHNRIWKVTGLLFLPFLLYGCGGAPTIRYMNPTANFTYVKKVAILPFSNFSDDKFAAEKVRGAFTINLMTRNAFEILEQGEVSKVFGSVKEEGAGEGAAIIQIDKATIKQLGGKLGVQAIIMGSVNDFSASSGRVSDNLISITVKMIDVDSGTILWQAATSQSGSSLGRKLLGLEQIDMNVLTNRAVKKVLNTLF